MSQQPSQSTPATSTGDAAVPGAAALDSAAAGESAPGEVGLRGAEDEPGGAEGQAASRSDPAAREKRWDTRLSTLEDELHASMFR